jgi:hypothetical protein
MALGSERYLGSEVVIQGEFPVPLREGLLVEPKVKRKVVGIKFIPKGVLDFR